MFYLRDNGAQVGDMYLSLIYPCQLCGVNLFDYPTELQRHAQQVAAHPQNWMERAPSRNALPSTQASHETTTLRGLARTDLEPASGCRNQAHRVAGRTVHFTAHRQLFPHQRAGQSNGAPTGPR